MAKGTKTIYLDYASTTPVLPDVFDVMEPYFTELFQNPSSIYSEGVATKKTVTDAREKIAEILGARKEEIIFTGSGTESDNLALIGVFEALSSAERKGAHVVTTEIEHPAVLESVREIENRGGEASHVGVEANGIVDPKKIASSIKPNTVLISVIYANNEIGTVQPIVEIAKAVRFEKKRRLESGNMMPIYFHVDASQAANYLDLDVERLGVDLMTLDGSKIYGPKGVGILYVKKGVKIYPIIFGGGQEKGVRSGTENVAAIVGVAKALEIAQLSKEKETERISELRDFLISEIKKKIPNAVLNGDLEKRLPNNANFCFPFIDAEFLVIKLDRAGIKCSSTSSCRNLKGENSSYVISALGADKENACSRSSIRFSLGRSTEKKDIEIVIERLIQALSEK